MLISGTARAVNFTFGAVISSGFSFANGTDLDPGSLVRIGTFSLTNSQIVANANNLTLLNSSFREITFATIGEGDPAGFGSVSDPGNAGLFVHSLGDVDTTASGLNIAGLQLYYWVFNAPSLGAATQQGIFSSTTWIIPSGSGTFSDSAALDTDIIDLTTGQDGLTLALNAQILVGYFGPGVNITGSAFGGGTDFDLAPIAVPQPAHTSALIGFAATALLFIRRGRAFKFVRTAG